MNRFLQKNPSRVSRKELSFIWETYPDAERRTSAASLAALAGAGPCLRIKRKLEEARADLAGVFLCGGNGAIAVGRHQQFHLHGDLENNGSTHADGKRVVGRVEGALGGHGADHAFHREGHDGRRRNEEENVLVHRHG